MATIINLHYMVRQPVTAEIGENLYVYIA